MASTKTRLYKYIIGFKMCIYNVKFYRLYYFEYTYELDTHM